jgi:hypothetical protein
VNPPDEHVQPKPVTDTVTVEIIRAALNAAAERMRLL